MSKPVTQCRYRLIATASLAVAAVMLAPVAPAAETGHEHYEGWAFAMDNQPSLARQFSQLDLGIDPTGTQRSGSRAFTAQLSRYFQSGLALDAGMSSGTELNVDLTDYQDAFLGVRYHQLSGRVWYQDNALSTQSRSFYYQAGWTTDVSRQLSLSLELGQSYHDGRFERQYPDLSIAARAQMKGYGIGLRLIDRTGLGFGEPAGFSLMGSINKSFE